MAFSKVLTTVFVAQAAALQVAGRGRKFVGVSRGTIFNSLPKNNETVHQHEESENFPLHQEFGTKVKANDVPERTWFHNDNPTILRAEAERKRKEAEWKELKQHLLTNAALGKIDPVLVFYREDNEIVFGKVTKQSESLWSKYIATKNTETILVEKMYRFDENENGKFTGKTADELHLLSELFHEVNQMLGETKSSVLHVNHFPLDINHSFTLEKYMNHYRKMLEEEFVKDSNARKFPVEISLKAVEIPVEIS
jgi:hypothetical protein